MNLLTDLLIYFSILVIAIILLYLVLFVARDKNGFNVIGYDEQGFDRKGFSRLGFNRDGYNANGYDKLGFNQKGFNQTGYDRFGYDKNGYNALGFNALGFDKNGYDSSGFNSLGYDLKGFDRNGFNQEGYNKQGINKDGFDKDGYTLLGYDFNGIDREGYNVAGFNAKGYNRLGYDAEGFNLEGYNRLGYDKKGYDRDGYNADGFNKIGFNNEGKDIHGDPWWLAGLYKKTLFNNKEYVRIYSEDSEIVQNENNFNLRFIDPWADFINSFPLNNINVLDYSLNNPYNLLGIDIKSDNKTILRRSSDIKKIMSIEGDMSFCLSVFKQIIHRTTNFYEKETYTKITDPTKKIAYQFFWFYHPSNQLVATLLAQDNQNVTYIISKLIKEYATTNDIFALKSAILLTNMYGAIMSSAKNIIDLIPYWNDVINHEEIWTSHKDIYISSLDTESRQDDFLFFKENFIHHLAEYYFQIYEILKDKAILTSFQRTFNYHSEKAQKELLYPLLQSLNDIHESLDKFDKSSFNSSNVNKSIKLTQENLDALKKIKKQIEDDHFDDHLEVKNVFEKLASTIRSTAIDLLNEVDHSSSYFEQGIDWLKEAMKYSESSVLINRIKQDLEDISTETKKKTLLDQIKSDFKSDYYDAARTKINKLKALDNSYENLKLANELLLISYKNQAHYNLNKAIKNANSMSDSGIGRLAIPMVIRSLKEAISEIDVLILIADKQDDYSEKSDLLALKDKLSNNIRQLTYL